MTELERGEHLARRKDIYIARHPETRAGVAGAVAKHGLSANAESSFAEDAASKLGISDRSIQIAVRRAEKICGKAKELIRGTEIEDIGVELDALAMGSPKQRSTRHYRLH